MTFTEYIVKEGDRWDTVAFKAYGDASLVNTIVEANVSTTVSPVLIAGSRLKIPILEPGEAKLDSELLPPWKR